MSPPRSCSSGAKVNGPRRRWQSPIDQATRTSCLSLHTGRNHDQFCGSSCKARKTILKAEIDETARTSLYSNVFRVFEKLDSGPIADKTISPLGDEVIKVFELP